MKPKNWIALAIVIILVTALLVWWGHHTKVTGIAQRSQERKALLAECQEHIAFLEGAGSFLQLVNEKLGRDPVTTAQLTTFLNERFRQFWEDFKKQGKGADFNLATPSGNDFAVLRQLQQAIVRQTLNGSDQISSRYKRLSEQTPPIEAAQPDHQELIRIAEKELRAKVMNVAINDLDLADAILVLEKRIKDKP